MKPRGIYFLNWNSHKCFIADFPQKSQLIEFLEDENFKGYYGSSPGAEDMKEFQSLGKVKIEMALRAWYNDSRFLIHFILTTGIFLLSFYFLSYIIRDPLPLVDEIVLSLVLALLGWYRLNNQDLQSEKVLLKKQGLIQALDRIPFEKSPFLVQVELYLEKLSTMKIEEIDRMLEEGATPLFFNTFKDETVDFRKALDCYFSRSRKKRFFSKKSVTAETVLDLKELKVLKKQLNSFVINR